MSIRRDIVSIVIIEVSSLLIESVAAAASLMGEAKHRKSSAAAAAVVAALPTLDFDAALAGATDARLAAMMRGAVTKKSVERVIQDDQVRRLVSELVLAVLVDRKHQAVAEISELVSSRICEVLESSVAREDAEFLATGLADLTIDFATSLINAALEASPDIALGIQQLATLRRTQSILERVSDQLSSAQRASSAELAKERRSFMAEYRAVCADVHGSIKPPDFETNQRIPIEDLYVPARLAPTGDPENGSRIDPHSLMERVDRTVLLGDPGGGKSTLSNYLTLLWARDDSGPVPFHVILRDYAQEGGPHSIVDFIESQLPTKYQLQALEGAVEDCLTGGNAVVVFDGLDELTDPTKRRAITSAVETFAFRYPMVRVLVTSRRVGYEQARLDPTIFESFLLDGFSPDEVETYVRKWFDSQSSYTDVEARRLSEQFMSQSRAVEELSSNPLMLSLMCIIFRGESFIPRNRPAIYEKCANLLFEKWDGHRQIEVPLLARDYVDVAMKHLAFVFLSREAGDSGIRRSQLVREMVSYLYPRAMETEAIAERAADEFVSFCAGRAWVFSDAGTTAEGEEIFTFTHRTFMEYFAAVHLLRISGTPEKLANELLPRIAREEWDVVAQLAVQQADRSHDQGTERALRTMLRDTRRKSKISRGRVLLFIVRCIEFAVVSPAFLQDMSAACLDFYLANFSPEDRGPGDSLRTVLALQDHVPEAHTQIVASVHREMLRTILSSDDDPNGDNALYYLLLGLIRRFNGRAWREDRRAELWSSIFVEVAEVVEPKLRKHASTDSYIWFALAVGGVVAPGEAIGEMRSAGMTFPDIYLHTARVREFDVSGAPLVSMVNSALLSRRKRLRDLDIIEAIAGSFLADFWSASRSRVVVAPDLGHIYIGDSVIERIGDRDDVYRDLRDFAVLAYLALSEVAEASGDSRPRPAASEAESLERLALSPKAKTFAREWLEGTRTVFDSIAPPEAQ